MWGVFITGVFVGSDIECIGVGVRFGLGFRFYFFLVYDFEEVILVL